MSGRPRKGSYQNVTTEGSVSMRKALHMMGILNEADIAWLAHNGVVLQVDEGAVLIEEQRAINHMYIVLDGMLSVVVGGKHGRRLATLHSGEVIGEISFVDSSPPTASVVALTSCRLLAVPTTGLVAKLDNDQAFAARFYHSIANYLADRLATTVTRLGYGSASQDAVATELPESVLRNIDTASTRFDDLLRLLQSSHGERVEEPSTTAYHA